MFASMVYTKKKRKEKKNPYRDLNPGPLHQVALPQPFSQSNHKGSLSLLQFFTWRSLPITLKGGDLFRLIRIIDLHIRLSDASQYHYHSERLSGRISNFVHVTTVTFSLWGLGPFAGCAPLVSPTTWASLTTWLCKCSSPSSAKEVLQSQIR